MPKSKSKRPGKPATKSTGKDGSPPPRESRVPAGVKDQRQNGADVKRQPLPRR